MIDLKSIERLAYGYELMHRAICNLAGTAGADCRWYMEVAQRVHERIDPIFEVCAVSNLHKPGDCLSGYKIFLSANVPEPAAQPLYDRLLKLAESVACGARTDDVAEARAIMAELQPVDPVILKARELRLQQVGHCGSEDWRRYLSEGAYDEDKEVVLFADAIRFGMTMAVQP